MSKVTGVLAILENLRREDLSPHPHNGFLCKKPERLRDRNRRDAYSFREPQLLHRVHLWHFLEG
ncbi:hypothetical protein RRF57_000337 [Xylaria bambusicola]|uniref:Uncharacterized protein n=1 Tax=Xylaria bambusicola TaxID=326684 RepID=A0AAN7Z5I1_9PEZI